MPAAVPAAIGAALLLFVQDVLHVRRRDPSLAERVHGILHVIEREIEWPTLSFFALLFIAVGAGVETGLIDTLSNGLAAFIGWGEGAFGLSETGTLLFAGLHILWTSGILSALIDNIPFVAVVIPIIGSLTGQLSGDTEVLWWSLALGACLGGNGTAIGASANVTVIGLAERSGAPVGFREFARFGARVTAMTLVASSFIIAGYLYIGRLPSQAIAVALVLAGALLARARRPAPAPAS
jgi:Na+/H+ antiporter NhaD/arsenite permease-like protein